MLKTSVYIYTIIQDVVPPSPLSVYVSGYRIEGILSDRRQNSHTRSWTQGAAGRHILVTPTPWCPQGFLMPLDAPRTELNPR